MRQRLCIQPVWLSWRMAASMIGMPVWPSPVEPVLVVLPGKRRALLAVGAIGLFREMEQAPAGRTRATQFLFPHGDGLRLLLAAGLLPRILGQRQA